MDKSKTATQDMNAMMARDMKATMTQGVELVRGAMEHYHKFFQKSMPALLWAGTELNKKLTECVQKNIASAFGLSQKLTQAKDLQDMVRIQSEFFRAHGW